MKRTALFIIFALALMTSCKEKEVVVPLQAAFACEETTVLVGNEVAFIDNSTGGPSKWNWTFEGAETNTSVLSQPSVRWMTAGTYSVTLSVSKGTETSTETKAGYITVTDHPTVVADFTISTNMTFDDMPVTFTNNSTGYPSHVKWTFAPKEGDPIVSTEYSPTLTLPPGLYTVTLEIHNSIASDTKVMEDVLTIVDRYAIIPSFDADNRTTYTGGKVWYKNTSEGAVGGQEWTFEGGTPASSTEAEPVVTYAAAGWYKTTMRVYNDKYNHTVTKENYIFVVPGEGLIFLLPFDGNLKDYGPYGLHPNVYSKAPAGQEVELTFEDGLHGPAVKFPSSPANHSKGGPYAVLWMPADEFGAVYPPGSDMTLSFWFKISGVTSNRAFFHEGDCPGTPNADNAAWARFQSNHQIRAYAAKTGSTPNGVTVTKADVDNGEWHHIALVYNKNANETRNLVVYYEGVQVGQQNNQGAKDTNTYPFFIGCNIRYTNNQWAPENIFNGSFDDYMLYDRRLSDEEIKTLATKKE